MEATIRVLNEMIEAGVLEAYALGGAMAAVFYIEPVATFDLDVFVTLPASERDRVVVTLEHQYQWLADRGYEEAGFDRARLDDLVDRFGLRERWIAWTT